MPLERHLHHPGPRRQQLGLCPAESRSRLPAADSTPVRATAHQSGGAQSPPLSLHSRPWRGQTAAHQTDPDEALPGGVQAGGGTPAGAGYLWWGVEASSDAVRRYVQRGRSGRGGERDAAGVFAQGARRLRAAHSELCDLLRQGVFLRSLQQRRVPVPVR
uniref:(northern house mosquito) hypothetical protein n=1 Tax=Culex pipiens TaxID=7175 RepID=A0A8D8J2M5_CULPI